MTELTSEEIDKWCRTKPEFNLSDKIKKSMNHDFFILEIGDVKEFIKRIIKKFEGMEIVSGQVIKFEINQLAGEDLK